MYCLLISFCFNKIIQRTVIIHCNYSINYKSEIITYFYHFDYSFFLHYRCKRYDAPNCMMIPDPADPSCCEIPLCLFAVPTPAPGVSPTPGFIRQTGRPGEVFGVGNIPTPMPTQAPTRGPDGLFHTPTPLYGPDGSTITPSPPTGKNSNIHLISIQLTLHLKWVQILECF